jgi:hypothetical protein
MANGHGGRRNRFRKRTRKPAASEEGAEGSQISVADGEDMQSERPTRIFHLHRSAARKKTSSISEDVSLEEVNKSEV